MTIRFRWGAIMRLLIFATIASILMPGVPDWLFFVWGFIDPIFTFNSEPKSKGKHAA